VVGLGNLEEFIQGLTIEDQHCLVEGLWRSGEIGEQSPVAGIGVLSSAAQAVDVALLRIASGLYILC
jgi:hypothetical protein